MMPFKKAIILVDASRCRSGGSLQHFYQLFIRYPPENFLHVRYIFYVSQDIKKILPQHVPYDIRTLRYNVLIYELLWQFLILPIIYWSEKADLIFTLDSSSLCEVKKQVVLNQDLLCFSLTSLDKKCSLSYLRQVLIKILSIRRLKKARKAIFLTENAKNLYCKTDKRIFKRSKIIPHGFSNEYLHVKPPSSLDSFEEINIVYVSPVVSYKNHDCLVEAVKIIRSTGMNLRLNCVGSYDSNNPLIYENSQTKHINFTGPLLLYEIVEMFNSTQIVIFASSCESFGITLLEKMASSIPLSTSRESGLLELVGVDYPFTFDPKDPSSIAKSIRVIINNYDYALSIGRLNRKKSLQYDWQKISKSYHDLLYNESVGR